MKNISTASLCKYDPHEKSSGNNYQNNIKEPKMIYVPKFKT